jgi:hypothetical protein
MSKKAFSLVIIVLLILIGLLAWIFLRPNGSNAPANGSANQNPFPFGQTGGTTNGGQGGQQGTGGNQTGSTTIDLTTINQGGSTTRRLKQISLVPTSGIVAFDAASTTKMRYMERATGHIYEINDRTGDAAKISNITIPKVHEALWASDGSKLLIRYLKDDGETIRTFYAKVSTSTKPEQSLEGAFLADGIKDVTVSGSKIFYFDVSAKGSQGISANIDGTGKTSVFNSSFRDWAPRYTSAAALTIETRPSGFAESAAYSLNPLTGAYAEIASGTGVSALLNADGAKAVYSTGGRSIGTVAYDMKTGSKQTIGISTLIDKCVWSKKDKDIIFCAVPKSIPGGIYPDDWYKGRVSFDDSVWKIDVATGATENLFDPLTEAGSATDIIDLSLDQDENVLVFINKTDMTAWRYRLTE